MSSKKLQHDAHHFTPGPPARIPDVAGSATGVLTYPVQRKFLVRTDHGDVLVRIDPEKGGLDPDLLVLERPDADKIADLQATVPLRAFGAKMVELIEAQGGDVPGGERLRQLLVREKASSDMNRIERWAKEHVGD